MSENTKLIHDLISFLNKDGLEILEINNQYFAIDDLDFEKIPDEKGTDYLIRIEGKNITDIIIGKAGGAQNATQNVIDSIKQTIENKYTIVRKYSSHHSFIHFQPNLD